MPGRRALARAAELAGRELARSGLFAPGALVVLRAVCPTCSGRGCLACAYVGDFCEVGEIGAESAEEDSESMARDTVIKYVRDQTQPSRLIGVFAGKKDGGDILIGWALCRDGEQFTKKIGREIALGRLAKTPLHGSALGTEIETRWPSGVLRDRLAEEAARFSAFADDWLNPPPKRQQEA